METKDKEEKKWFKRKLYGWGWTPCTWQGWVAILVWVVLFIFGVAKMDHEWFKNLIVIFIMTGALIWLCYKKGERPRWQWGKRKE